MLSTEPKTKRSNSWTEHDEVDAQQRIRSQAVGAASISGQRRVSPFKRQQWWAWVVILLAWVGLFVVFALLFNAHGRDRTSEVESPAHDRVVVALVKFCQAVSRAK